MSKPQLVGVVWWPHSGGRWLCRSLLQKHPNILLRTFVHPWLFFTTDMTMDVDITAQVHKARSLPDHRPHLIAIKQSLDAGRVEGLKTYFDYIKDHYLSEDSPETHILGEMCLGSPIPRPIDLEALYKACPEIKLIHLVRSPEDSFPSFAVRHELDSSPARTAGSWVMLNAEIRVFFEQNPQFQSQNLVVRYEDLLQDADHELQKISEFMGLPFSEEMTAGLEQRWGRNTKRKTDPRDAEIIRTIAKEELKRFGYDD